MNELVKMLNYGGNDEHGTFCEALVIRTDEGDKYVLHRGRSEPKPTGFVYEKVEFTEEEDLVKAWPGTFLPSNSWRETDSGCGYGITQDQYREAQDAMDSRES